MNCYEALLMSFLYEFYYITSSNSTVQYNTFSTRSPYASDCWVD